MTDAAVFADRYLLLQRLQRRGAVAVWRAACLREGHTVALRIVGTTPSDPAAAASGEPADAARIRRETTLLRRIRHPGIARCTDAGVTADAHYLATEWIDGVDLRTWLAAQPRTTGAPGDRANMRQNRTVEVFAKVADALHRAHQAGVLHRDLHPGNVLMHSAFARPVVIDFGLALGSTGEGSTQLTRTLEMVGTPAYLSPEAVVGAPVTEASDVFSLAVMLREALTGALPFEGATPLDLALARLEPPSAESAEWLEVPCALRGTIDAALSLRVQDRPRSMRALARMLRRSLADSRWSLRPWFGWTPALPLLPVGSAYRSSPG